MNCIGIVATPDQQPSTQLFARDEQRLSLGDLLAVLNDNIRQPINIQNRRNKQTFDTYVFTIDIFPHVLEIQCFAGLIHEIHGNMTKRRNLEKCKAETCKRIKGESPPTCQTQDEHQCGSYPGPARSPSEQGGGERTRLGCGRTAPSAPQPHLVLAVAWRHAQAVLGGFLFPPKPTINKYKQGGGAVI